MNFVNLDDNIVLELNKSWMRVKWRTIRDAIVCLCPNRASKPNALVVPLDRDGISTPMLWDDFIRLPVRDDDCAIMTSRGAIRAPLALIAINHDKIHWRTPAVSNKAIFERDKGVDQYTNEPVPKSEGNVDHVIPRDVWKKRGLKGSPDRFDNMVWTRKKRNFDKGNQMNHKVGYKLIKRPRAPKAIPVNFLITSPKHEWQSPLF